MQPPSLTVTVFLFAFTGTVNATDDLWILLGKSAASVADASPSQCTGILSDPRESVARSCWASFQKQAAGTSRKFPVAIMVTACERAPGANPEHAELVYSRKAFSNALEMADVVAIAPLHGASGCGSFSDPQNAVNGLMDQLRTRPWVDKSRISIVGFGNRGGDFAISARGQFAQRIAISPECDDADAPENAHIVVIVGKKGNDNAPACSRLLQGANHAIVSVMEFGGENPFDLSGASTSDPDPAFGELDTALHALARTLDGSSAAPRFPGLVKVPGK